eukprot:CAMPEP_0202685700 /NCGR_PEP_ID=MMETSP1385-20130828/1531_1 /ASSEMBLY_ACC=CAM_ASM_000861 /TAXON_ID=933848 /ORGANISM="Elphidium margaritaceum" /LENGTH=187 /DNA_ID=CAMNT_0049340125 /DNA_START=99 /DNA_END=662 /DNA_ORIENTATION=+
MNIAQHLTRGLKSSAMQPSTATRSLSSVSWSQWGSQNDAASNRVRRHRAARDWRVPQNDEDTEKYLMRWQNVEGNEFLTAMREQLVQYGTKNWSDKQKEAVKRCAAHPSVRVRRALYPKYLVLDPIMKELLTLDEKDFQNAQSQNKELGQTLQKLRDDLNERNSLSYKQLKFAGSLMRQFFGAKDEK